MIRITGKGDFSKTTNFLNKLRRDGIFGDLDRYGQWGVDALSRATPVDTGLAEHSWYYKIIKDDRRVRIDWHNSDVENDQVVVVLVQYGHATKNGGYVSGTDFINPAMRSVFDEIANDIWKKVTTL